MDFPAALDPRDPAMLPLPPAHRTRRVLIAAAVVMVLLVTVFVLQQQSPHPSPQSSTQSSTTTSLSTGQPTSAGDAPGTSTAATTGTDDTTGLSTPPNGITWSLFRGLALPSSATAGPTRVDGPVYAGFAHTPTGALIAAEQVTSRALLTPDGGWRQVLDQQVMDTPGRAVYAGMRAQVNDSLPTAGLAQIAGFKFVTYTPDLTVITVANKNANGTYNTTNVTMQWSAGDWKLRLPDSGWPSGPVLANIDTFVPFSGIS